MIFAPIQVVEFQFATELLFIEIEPFSEPYFTVLLLKAVLHLALKGGLLRRLHEKLRERLVNHT